MTAPEFSIIVPTYNRPQLLSEALASVQAQTVTDFECIVIDDGTFTGEAVLPPNDPRFRCLSMPENIGNYAARNVGIDAARGDAVCFLDDDDILTPNRLDLARRGLKTHDLALCWSSYLGHTGPVDPPPTLEGLTYDVILDSTCPTVGVTTVRRTALRHFDSSYPASGDVEWWLRQSAVPLTTIPEVGYLVRRHDGVRSTNSTDRRIEASKRMLAEIPYFADHRRARAFREYRLSMMEHSQGRRTAAARHAVRSIVAHPSLRAMRALSRSPLPVRDRSG